MSLGVRNAIVLLTLAGCLGLVFLAIGYWERTVRVEPTQGVTHAPLVRRQPTPGVTFLGYSELLDKDYEGTTVGGSRR